MEKEYEEVQNIQKDKSLVGVQFYEKMMKYLLTTQEILYDAAFRASALHNLQQVINNPHYAQIKPLLESMIAKIHQVQQDITNHVSKNTEMLGKGSFGCVVKPALPNRIDGKWEMHTNNVSKLYFRKENARKGIQNAETMYEYLKNDGHKMMKQKLTYKGSNMPSNTRRKCEIGSNAVLTSTRMPNLGISVSDALRRYKEFRKIPVRIIFGQFVKLFQQLTMIMDKGYVHGDIRETNVMVNPKTGTFTLIDFDWYMPKQAFFEKYKLNLGFYSNPPESLLYAALDKFTKGKPLEYKMDPQTLYTYVTSSNITRIQQKLSGPSIHAANFQNLQQFSAIRSIQEYFETMSQTFDSYGLGITLLAFCDHVYPYGLPMRERFAEQGQDYTEEEAAQIEAYLLTLYKTILYPLTDLDMRKRLQAKEAFARMKQLQEDFEVVARGFVSNNLERFAKRTEIIENYKPKGPKTRKRRA